MFSKDTSFYSLLLLPLILGTGAPAHALTFEMEIEASIPAPPSQVEGASTRIVLATDDRATDDFDTAWDVVAIQGGMIQVYIDHPEEDQATRNLWKDTRASTGLPKQWSLLVLSGQAETRVTLDWSAADFSNLPSGIRVRLINLDLEHEEIDMRSVPSYSYLHADETRPRHFQIIMEESTAETPPSESSVPEKDSAAKEPDPAPASAPPVIVTELLDTGYLRSSYTAQLQGQGGSGPYRWEIVSGELPEGLSLNQGTGLISGHPRQIGRYRLMVQLIDAEGFIYQKAFILSISRRAVPPRR